jgi:Flp pilus assembly protein TadD
MRNSREWFWEWERANVSKRISCAAAVHAVVYALAYLLVGPCATAQDVGSQEKEYLGSGSVITVKVHDASGQSFSSSAVVKLFRGVSPSGQRDTTRGVAEFVVNHLGEFTVVVSAPGYAEAQKDISVLDNGRTQVDVYLRPTSTVGSVSTVTGGPVLAPKAKEALDKGVRALKENELPEAEKYVSEAMRLAPGNPDVLYVQGVLNLKKRDWGQAQSVLEKATQMDPNSARAFAALGMAFCDDGRFDAAIPPLEKSLQLDQAGTWETRWALAKSYYRRERYHEALEMSQRTLAQSNGKEPEIALLVAQSLTAVGRYEDAAQTLRAFLKDHGDRPEAVTARRWLEQLTVNGKMGAK